MIGALDLRATLLRPSESGDGGGGTMGGWNDIATVWVGLSARGGGSAYGPDAREARGTYEVRMRRRPVSAGQRLRIGARLFDILCVEDEGPRTPYLRLRCEALP